MLYNSFVHVLNDNLQLHSYSEVVFLYGMFYASFSLKIIIYAASGHFEDNLCFNDIWNVFAVVDGTTPLGIPLIPVRVMGL